MSNIRFIKIVSRLILKGFFPVVYPFLIWPDISLIIVVYISISLKRDASVPYRCIFSVTDPDEALNHFSSLINYVYK